MTKQREVEDLENEIIAAEVKVAEVRQAIIDGSDDVTTQDLIDAEAELNRLTAVLDVTREMVAARSAREAEDARLSRRASYLDALAEFAGGDSAADRLVVTKYRAAVEVMSQLAAAIKGYNDATAPVRSARLTVANEAHIDADHAGQPHLSEELRSLPPAPDELLVPSALAEVAVEAAEEFTHASDRSLLALAAGSVRDHFGALAGQSGPYVEAGAAAFAAPSVRTKVGAATKGAN